MATVTLEEIIVRAQQVATGTVTDSGMSVLNDSDLTLEALLAHCANYVTAQWTKDTAKRAQLREAIAVTFTSGSAAIPSGLIKDWPLDAEWRSESESLDGLVTFCANPGDAQHHRKPYLYYAYLDGSNIKLLSGAGDAFAGSVSLYAPKQPALSGGNVVGPERWIEELVLCLAATLRGEIPLAVILAAPPRKK